MTVALAIKGLRFAGDPRARLELRRRGFRIWKAGCLGLLLLVLLKWADPAVQTEIAWFVFLVLAGSALLWGMERLMPFVGLSPEEDVIQAGNVGAMVTVYGGLLGAMLCFAGSNVGLGETEWTTLFPAMLALFGFLLCWTVHEAVAHASDLIVREWNTAAGVRLGLLLVSFGALFGKAAAGDWVSQAATLHDWAVAGAVAFVLSLAAAAVHRLLRRAQKPQVVLTGILPGLSYLLVSVSWGVLH